MAKLNGTSKFLLVAIVVGSTAAAAYTRRDRLVGKVETRVATTTRPESRLLLPSPEPPAPATVELKRPAGKRPVRAALSEWPGHMALVLGNGGLRTQPGSAASAEGLDLEIVFIEDAPKKNGALADGDVDFVWQTVDELPISLGSYKKAGVEVRAFIQIDWSRGGDACVASREVKTVEDILGRKSAMLMFSPDHTVFEFMITNSRLTREQVARVREQTRFSPDDFTFARKLFTSKSIDVACLWEPDVTLALRGRPGAHRLFSTADASELVADVLLTRKDLLDTQPDVAAQVARVWFAGVKQGEADKAAAAKMISTVVPRFTNELGYQQTLDALGWVKWTDLGDNVPFFGLDGQPPSFDRVYNQADSIWINYPQAEIKDRFAPVTLRDDRTVRRLWEAGGRRSRTKDGKYRAEVALTGTALFTKPISISFPTSKSDLDAEAMAVTNHHVLPQLEIARSMHIRVEGNTDSLSDESWNQMLSERRAQAVVEYLISRGVAAERIVAKGNGSSRPVTSNRTPEGRARNRRTDILFISTRQ